MAVKSRPRGVLIGCRKKGGTVEWVRDGERERIATCVAVQGGVLLCVYAAWFLTAMA